MQHPHARDSGAIPIGGGHIRVRPLPHKHLHIGKGCTVIGERLQIDKGAIKVEE